MTANKTSTAMPNLLLRRAREEHGWTQADLAQQLDTNPFTVCRWERGTTSPSLHYRKKLCDVLQQSEASLGLLSPTASETSDSIQTSHIPIIHPFSSIDSIVPSHALIGREEVIDNLAFLLQTPATTSIALYGLPGVGKTALAAALARLPEVIACYPDGVLWAGLGPAPAIITHLGRWATTLGLTTNELAAMTTTRALSETLHMLIGEQRMLIVLDDVWAIDDALAYKIGGAQCAYIVTTRFPPIAAQFAHNHAFHLSEFDEETSIAFLRHFQPPATAWAFADLQGLVHAVGGLPLALQLMGHYLHLQSFSQQPRRIQQALEYLRDTDKRLRLTEPIAPLERPPALPADAPYSVEAVIAVSVSLLSAQVKHVLQLLALFPAKPNTFAEEAILALYERPIEHVFEAVDTLIDAGLLESSGEGRYMLHQTINDYARLATYAPINILALLRFYRQRLQAAQAQTDPFDQEVANLMAVCEAAYHQCPDMEFVESVFTFMGYFAQRGLYTQASILLQQAYVIAQEKEARPALLTLTHLLGRNAESVGDYPAAMGWAHAGISLAQELHDDGMELQLQHLLGMLLRKQGENAAAEPLLVAGLERARAIHQPALAMPYLMTLAALLSDRGDIAQAERLFQQGLRIALEHDDQRSISGFLQNLGVLAARAGNLADARAYFSEGIAVARVLGERRIIAKGLRYIGQVALEQGDDSIATTYLEEGLAIAQEIGFHEALYRLLLLLGEAALAQGKYDDARRYSEEAYRLIKDSKNREGNVDVLMTLGKICRHQAQMPAAQNYLQEALVNARTLARKEIIARVLCNQGELYLAREEIDNAATAFREAESLAREYGYHEIQGTALYGIACVAVANGDVQTALHFGERSLHLLEVSTSRQANEVRHWLNVIQA